MCQGKVVSGWSSSWLPELRLEYNDQRWIEIHTESPAVFIVLAHHATKMHLTKSSGALSIIGGGVFAERLIDYEQMRWHSSGIIREAVR